MDWHIESIKMSQEGLNAGDITRRLQNMGFFGDEPFNSCYERVRKYVRKHKEPIHIRTQNFEPKEVNLDWNGNNVITIAIISDTHICGKYTQLTYLNQFYDLCKLYNIKKVFHAGDITDGWNMRVGHINELYKHGLNDQMEHLLSVYPRRPGIETYFITGNHDASVYKSCGADIGKFIDCARDDMHYLGQDWARVNLTNNCTLELRHPWDGSSYAISAKTQKIVDNLDPEDKPNILVVGHYHKAEYLFYKNVHIFQPGCFQMPTPFERGRNILSTMGGWILKLYLDNNGEIKLISPTFVPFSKGIKDDFKSFV